MSIDFYRRLVAAAREEGIRKFTVRAVIPRGRRLLVLSRPRSYNGIGSLDEFVGGKVRSGENLGVAINREIMQEIGWYAKNVRKYLGHRDFKTDDGSKVREFYFEVTTSIPSHFRLTHILISLGEDHESYQWVRKNALNSLKIPQDVVNMMKQYYS